MPRPVSNIMPQTIEEWNELCENTHFNEAEAYDNTVAAARATIEARWDAKAPALRESLVAELEVNLNAETVQGENGPEPVSKAEWDKRWRAGVAQIDAGLARQKQEAINNAASSITPPRTLAQIQTTFGMYKPQEQPPMPEIHRVPPGQEIYEVGETYWSVPEAKFIPEPEDKSNLVVIGGAPTNENLRETLEFYGYPVGDELLTPAELIIRKRAAIDADTSAKILGGFDYEINGETLHFSYDAFDQQNFADTANACLMAKSGAEGLPQAITWNAYRHGSGELVRLTLGADEFLELYARGALAHKAVCMEEGGAGKSALANWAPAKTGETGPC